MTKTQLEHKMASMADIGKVDDETLVFLLIRVFASQDNLIERMMNLLLTVAKSRGMNLHALRDDSGWKPRSSVKANVYEILKVATGTKPINSKLIILIGMVNKWGEVLNDIK